MTTQVIDGAISFPGSVSFNGGSVTQTTSNTTAVTLNAKAGTVTMLNAVTAAGQSFTLNNSFISTTSKVLAFCTNTRCLVSLGVVVVIVGAPAAGSVSITAAGDGTNGTINAPIIQFIVV